MENGTLVSIEKGWQEAPFALAEVWGGFVGVNLSLTKGSNSGIKHETRESLISNAGYMKVF